MRIVENERADEVSASLITGMLAPSKSYGNMDCPRSGWLSIGIYYEGMEAGMAAAADSASAAEFYCAYKASTYSSSSLYC